MKQQTSRTKRGCLSSCLLGTSMALATCCLQCAAPQRVSPRTSFGLADVEQLAAAPLVQSPEASRDDIPASLKSLNYDGYRAISYRDEAAIWSGTAAPFRLEFYHRGYLFPDRVNMHLLEGGAPSPVPFHPELFKYAGGRPAGITGDLGFAGFRALFRLNSPGRFDEIVSFLGASYWRAVGAGGVYGASVRGVAVNAIAGGGPEEFPAFRSFWIQRPEPGAGALVVYALLEGTSVRGAYRFDITPGPATSVEVRARLRIREDGVRIGLAPITSMFFYGEGENFGPARQDNRPEVHDSDGMLLAAGTGEWLWRPLHNPRSTQVSSFRVDRLAGFGLLQRDRDAGHYRDTGAMPERRPSVWIEPIGRWEPGCLELTELASREEGMDNVRVQYLPDSQPGSEHSIDIHYRVRFQSDERGLGTGAQVAGTWRRRLDDGSVAYDVEFAGERLAGIEPQMVLPVVTATGGSVQKLSLARQGAAARYGVSFQIVPESRQRPVEMRAFLRAGNDVLSETWSDVWVW